MAIEKNYHEKIYENKTQKKAWRKNIFKNKYVPLHNSPRK